MTRSTSYLLVLLTLLAPESGRAEGVPGGGAFGAYHVRG